MPNAYAVVSTPTLLIVVCVVLHLLPRKRPRQVIYEDGHFDSADSGRRTSCRQSEQGPQHGRVPAQGGFCCVRRPHAASFGEFLF